MGGGDARLGDDLTQPGGGPVDRLDAVVDVEDLALAQQLAADGGADLLLLVGADEGQHRVPLLRRCRDRGHLADAGHRHLQRPGDRGGGHGQHVDVGAELLQLLLVLDAEALFLVDDDQAQVLELGLRREQAVGADDDVHRALAQAFQDRLGLGVGLEAGQRLDAHRELRVPLAERPEVLLHQQGRGHQDGDLLAVLDGLEGGPDGDLGLAVADVAADQTVHRDRLLHVLLDLGDGGELVGRLRVGEGVLQFPLPGGVRPEGVAGGRHAGAVELDEVGRDLLDGLLRAGLGLRPVGAAEAVQGGGLAADVLGDLLQLVGGDVEAVAGLAALGGRVLDDQVLAGRALHGALHHLDVTADAVLLVDDVVARLQGERVDGLAAAGRHPGAVAARRPLTGQVRLRQDGESEGRVDEAVLDRAARHVHDRRGDLGQVGVVTGRDALAAQHLDRTGRRAVRLGDEHRAPAVGEPALGVGEGLGGVPAVGLRGVHPQLQGVRVQLLVRGERRHRPPHHVQLAGPVPDVGDGPQGGRADVDGRLAAAGGGRPGGLEELLRRGHQVRRARAHPLRVAHDGHGALGQHVEQQLHLVDEDRREGLHALHRDPLGDLAEQFTELGVLLGQGTRTGADVLGEQQLAARRRPQAVLGDFEGALVGDLEVADLLDVVAPELDAQGVFLGGREHVEDAAADGELAALLHELHARVGGGREGVDDLVQIGGLSRPQGDRLQVAEALDLRLEHGPHGRDDDGDRAGLGVVGAGWARRRSTARRRPTVSLRGLSRSCGSVSQDGYSTIPVRREEGAQGRGQVLRLAARRRHRQHRAARVAGQGGDREGAGRRGADQVDMHAVAVCGRVDRFREGGVLGYGVEQTVQAHSGIFPSRGGQHDGPDARRGPGVSSVRRCASVRRGCGQRLFRSSACGVKRESAAQPSQHHPHPLISPRHDRSGPPSGTPHP
ncbi:putative Transcription-repair-coupling factor [Streptomyces afghaniensis 772]|uniref:Putative Transcription-repair-coupling factor n=1 Tax=Streptomyces afghaniensis 772 TaxID=1283301 RepID=S4N1S4_9ACTN|nr:putative Transcription-repair-coupling factor [Streptomyces afghaniensis 772]